MINYFVGTWYLYGIIQYFEYSVCVPVCVGVFKGVSIKKIQSKSHVSCVPSCDWKAEEM